MEDASTVPFLSHLCLPQSIEIPAFAQASISWLESNFDKRQLYTTGLKVFTSLDIVAQSETERVFNEKLTLFMKTLGLSKDPGMQGAFHDRSQADTYVLFMEEISRPPMIFSGHPSSSTSSSSFKPLVYAMAFSKDVDGNSVWSAFDTVPNERRTFPNTNG